MYEVGDLAVQAVDDGLGHQPVPDVYIGLLGAEVGVNHLILEVFQEEPDRGGITRVDDGGELLMQSVVQGIYEPRVRLSGLIRPC